MPALRLTRRLKYNVRVDDNYVLYSAMRFNFLYADRYVFRTGWVYPESYIPYCMVRYIVRGEAVFTINGVEINVHENQVVYIPEGCRLECHALGNHFEFISIRFAVSGRVASTDFLSEYFNVKTVTECAGDAEIVDCFMAVYLNATGANPGKMFRIRGNLELIVAWLVERAPKFHASKAKRARRKTGFSLSDMRRLETRANGIKQDPRIQVVMEYMASHPSEQFDSERMSKMANMSQSSLRRLFKSAAGKSPGKFIKELRMMTAARSLLATDERISQIAYDLGFDDPNYFARQFRETFGVSPQTYRKNARE